MEINPYGVAIAILLILIIASFVCMVLLMLLQAMGLFHIRKTSHFIAWSIIGGIALAIIFWQVKKHTHSNESPSVTTQPEATH